MSEPFSLFSQTVEIEGEALPDRERPLYSSVLPEDKIQLNQEDRKTPELGVKVVAGVFVGLVVIAAVVKVLSK